MSREDLYASNPSLFCYLPEDSSLVQTLANVGIIILSCRLKMSSGIQPSLSPEMLSGTFYAQRLPKTTLPTIVYTVSEEYLHFEQYSTSHIAA